MKNVITPEHIAWLRLARTYGLGPVTIKKLIARYKTAIKACEMVPELSARGGRVKKLPDVREIEREFEQLKKSKTNFLCPVDDNYPKLLKHIDGAPIVLNYRGRVDLLNQTPSIGIVGARNASVHGARMTEKMANELGEAGIVVHSGLARGIDTAAHKGALNTGTVAVVAGGLNNIYPSENIKLADAIADQGCLLTEEALNVSPKAQHFPKRNRIISGMSLAVLVVEATLKSGSLITARLAGEQGRDVMAVPGFPADPRASGPNALLKDGAILIRNTQDILDSMPQTLPHDDLFTGLEEPTVEDHFYMDDDVPAGLRTQILQSLGTYPITLEELAQALSCQPSNLSMPLLELELSGAIRYASSGKIALGDLNTELE